jgi:hypothetical protein
MAQAKSYVGEQRAILELGEQLELVKGDLINSPTNIYTLIKRISKAIPLYYTIIEDRSIEEKRQIVKDVLSIYTGDAGPRIVSFLLEHGAATVYTLEMELGLTKQCISYIMCNLERLRFAKKRDQAIPDKRITKKGPKDKVWVLEGATPKAVELAFSRDLKWRNPEKAKIMEEEKAKKAEAEIRQKEADMKQLQEKDEYKSWLNAQVDELLKSASSEKKFDYPEVEVYIKTIRNPLADARRLKYDFRDRLKDLGKWYPGKGSIRKFVPLPVPDDLLQDVLKAKDEGFTLCTCKAKYSVKLERCPECKERNIWKMYHKIRRGKYEKIPEADEPSPRQDTEPVKKDETTGGCRLTET